MTTARQTQSYQRHQISGEPEQLPRTPIRDPEASA
jgi:hypothetical protein